MRKIWPFPIFKNSVNVGIVEIVVELHFRVIYLWNSIVLCMYIRKLELGNTIFHFLATDFFLYEDPIVSRIFSWLSRVFSAKICD